MALCIDWAVSLCFSTFLFGGFALATSGMFLLEQLLFIGVFSRSLGHAIVGITLIRREHLAIPAPLAVLIRTCLLLCLIPVLLTDEHHRGLHDRAAGTLLIRQSARGCAPL